MKKNPRNGYFKLFCNPVVCFFLVFEIFILFSPFEIDRGVLPAVLRDLRFANVISIETGLGDRAYVFSVVMLFSYLSLPFLVKGIFLIEFDGFKRRFDDNKKRAFYAVLFFPVFLFSLIFSVFFKFGDPSFCVGCTTSSAPALFVAYGMVAPFSVAYCIAVELISVKYIFGFLWVKK